MHADWHQGDEETKAPGRAGGVRLLKRCSLSSQFYTTLCGSPGSRQLTASSWRSGPVLSKQIAVSVWTNDMRLHTPGIYVHHERKYGLTMFDTFAYTSCAATLCTAMHSSEMPD